MIHIFDLDDTLYDELLFVKSGFWAVATIGQNMFGYDRNQSYQDMLNILKQYGRGKVFDLWLRNNGKYSKNMVQQCIHAYRHHKPDICLYNNAKLLLNSLAGGSLYLVTDGHKIVQSNKVNALGIKRFFKHVYITHRYGIKHAKPSLYCFELIRKREKCDWDKMTYVGDNPNKDFINLNKVGVNTVRVHTGLYKQIKEVRLNYDAVYHISDLSEYQSVIERL